MNNWPIIDFHTHIFPDLLAERVISALEEAGGVKAYTRGTLGELIGSMDNTGIDRSVLMPVSTRQDQVKTINDFVISLAKHPRCVSFGTLHPDFEDFGAELRRLKGFGVKGVKFHPEYQEFYPDEERLFPIYEELTRLNIIAFFHAGKDIGFTSVHGLPTSFSKIKELFPEMKMVLAHTGGYQMWDEVKENILGKEIYLETSFTVDYMNPEEFLSLIDNHDPNLIMFGTDSPWKDQKDQLNKIRNIILDEGMLEGILSLNAERLLASE